MSNTSSPPEVIEVKFPSVYLIELEGDGPWQLLEKYELRGV